MQFVQLHTDSIQENTMAKTVTTRLDDKYVNKIDEMAAKKGIDRSALLRLFLINSLEEQMIRESLEDYKAGTITLWEAAQHCKLTLWEMIKEIEKAHIYTSYDLKALKNDLKALNG
jgi:metal-responsive CopG/Arc/MetJ family transcriptional regulator